MFKLNIIYLGIIAHFFMKPDMISMIISGIQSLYHRPIHFKPNFAELQILICFEEKSCGSVIASAS